MYVLIYTTQTLNSTLERVAVFLCQLGTLLVHIIHIPYACSICFARLGGNAYGAHTIRHTHTLDGAAAIYAIVCVALCVCVCVRCIWRLICARQVTVRGVHAMRATREMLHFISMPLYYGAAGDSIENYVKCMYICLCV